VINDSLLARSCKIFYGNGISYYNGTFIANLWRALNDVEENVINNADDHLTFCAELVQRYLCYHYYPLCDQTSGNIMPACRRSCNLMFNNNACSELLMNAFDIIEESNIIPPDDSCMTTVRSFPSPPRVASCIAIEGLLATHMNF